jgi:hypothetical protein
VLRGVDKDECDGPGCVYMYGRGNICGVSEKHDTCRIDGNV